MKAIACYVYAGNFSLGVMSEPGVGVLAHCEDPKPYGEEVLRLNPNYFGKVKVHPGPPWPIYPNLDLLYANPPCALFSNANTTSFEADSWRDDPRLACWWHVINQVAACLPRVFAVESVCQMYSKAPDHVRKVAEFAQRHGYRPHLFFHNTCFMGSAQDRKRVLLIGTRHELALADYLDEPALTVGQALKDVKPGNIQFNLEPRFLDVIKVTKPGEDLRRAWNRIHPEHERKLNSRGQVIGRPSFGHRRYRSDRPALVVMGYPIVHPSENRYLSLLEHQILADFPHDFKFLTDDNRRISAYSNSIQYCGRGVSSKVGAWLAKTVKATIRKRRPVGKDLRLRLINGLTGRRFENLTIVDDLKHLPALSLNQRPTSVPAAPKRTTAREPAVSQVAHAVVKGERRRKVSDLRKPNVRPPRGRVTEPDVGLGSGLYVRYLLTVGTTDVNAVLKLVHQRFPQSKAGPSDVYWNRRKLERDGGYMIPSRGEPSPTSSNKVKVTPTRAAPPAPKPRRPRQVRAAHPEPDREFDQSQLRIGSHGRYLHRDYSAHFFRWSFAKRFMRGNFKLLDVGCGQELPLMHLLFDGRLAKQNVPGLYVGCDLSSVKKPARARIKVLDEFNFVTRHRELRQHGPFDYVVCYEVIEHMTAEHGKKMLRAISHLVKEGGHLILSTPIYDPKVGAARNHVHEYTVRELNAVLRKTGFNVLKRFGTFMGVSMMKKMEPAHRRVADELKAYYDNDALACFLAPLYPDLARNNLWVCGVRP